MTFTEVSELMFGGSTDTYTDGVRQVSFRVADNSPEDSPKTVCLYVEGEWKTVFPTGDMWVADWEVFV